MKKILNINIGDEFGDLKCIDIVYKDHEYQYLMKCKICGREKIMRSSTIRRECGIYHKTGCGKGIKNKNSTFHSRYDAMKTRTNNPNYDHYDRYGGRGINSDAFECFIDFYDTMYDSFKELADKIGENNVSLERINNNGNYSPENCIWIDKKDQQSNTSANIYFSVVFPDNHIENHKSLHGFCLEHNLNYNATIDAMDAGIPYKNYFFKRLQLAIEYGK